MRKSNVFLLSATIICVFIASYNVNATNTEINRNKTKVTNNIVNIVNKMKDNRVLFNGNTKSSHITSKHNSTFNNDVITLENDSIEATSNNSNSLFTLLNKNKAYEIKQRVKNMTIQNPLTSSILTNSKINDFKPQAEKIADIMDAKDKKLVEVNYLDDGTIAYKWCRVYNCYDFDFDFILVVLDSKDGQLVQSSKRYLSNVKIKRPFNCQLKIVNPLSSDIKLSL